MKSSNGEVLDEKAKFKIRRKVLFADMDFEDYIAKQEEEIKHLEYVILLANMDIEDNEEKIDELVDMLEYIDGYYTINHTDQDKIEALISKYKKEG